MRAVLTSLLAFFLSGLAGGIVAQQLAVWTGATEEYILVFMATMLVVCVATVAFFIAQLVGDARKSTDRTALAALAVFALALVGLVGWTFSVPAEQRATKSDMAIIAGLILPGIAVIAAQWGIVRWRLSGSTAPRAAPGARA